MTLKIKAEKNGKKIHIQLTICLASVVINGLTVFRK